MLDIITGKQKQNLSNDLVFHPECKGYGKIIISVRLCWMAKEQPIIIDRLHGYDRG